MDAGSPTPHMRRSEWTRFQINEWACIALAVAAGGWGAVLGGIESNSALVFLGILPAGMIIVFTSFHMWARRHSDMSSTRYLSMFNAILAIVIAGSGFYLRASLVYTAGALVLGSLLTVLTLYQAYISYPSREGRRPLDPRTNI